MILSKYYQEGKIGKGAHGAGKPTSQHWAMSFFDRGPALAVTPEGWWNLGKLINVSYFNILSTEPYLLMKKIEYFEQIYSGYLPSVVLCFLYCLGC